jgi:hypothetical protein
MSLTEDNMYDYWGNAPKCPYCDADLDMKSISKYECKCITD